MNDNLSVRFDNTPAEIEAAYKAFQTKYALKRKLIYTIVYLIVVVLAADLIVKDMTNPTGYIAGGLALGILVFNWIKPVLIRRKMMQGMEDAGKAVQEGKAVAIGEIGRPHFECSPEIWDASNRVLQRGMEIAKENDVPVIIHCESGTTDTNRSLADIARKA